MTFLFIHMSIDQRIGDRLVLEFDLLDESMLIDYWIEEKGPIFVFTNRFLLNQNSIYFSFSDAQCIRF